MARTGARSVCLSVASVPFFGGGGRFGRSWGMRQSRPGCCRASCCGARRALLAAAPSNTTRAACGELAAPVLIAAMKTYRKHVLGRAMVPAAVAHGRAAEAALKIRLPPNFASLALAGVLRPSAVVFRLCSKAKDGCRKSAGCAAPSRPFTALRRCLVVPGRSQHQIYRRASSFCS